MAILLGSVASVSLLVGGIGIMNIMLVSVTERTREIGIRMAVGAKEKDILLQFLVEAVVLSLIGGIIGIVLGVGLSTAVAMFSQFKTSVSLYSVLLSFLFSAAVGIFFGFYPAKKAAGMDPISALRYE
jgi:putative ABC transport system permease protein